LWAWPAVPLLQAPRERPGDRPAAERRHDLTASQSPLMLSVCRLERFAREREPPSIPTVEITNLRRTTLMNEDRVIGNAKNVGGQVEEGFGRATGDVKSQLQGKAKQMEGAVQDVYGQVKETASDAVEAIRESASGAEDFLRTTIEERPYTAAAVALGIGYLIGRLSRRDNY
jgi:uncharacterized protein YjbJ (UPF0337 family)